jgi:hypothetical protein
MAATLYAACDRDRVEPVASIAAVVSLRSRNVECQIKTHSSHMSLVVLHVLPYSCRVLCIFGAGLA